MVKSYENLVDSDTKVDVNTGIVAANRLQSLIDSRDYSHDLLVMKVQMDHICDAVRSTVPQEMWGEIIEKLDEAEQHQEALDVGRTPSMTHDDPYDPTEFIDEGRRVLTSAAPTVTERDGDRCRCERGVRGRLDPSGFRAVRCSLHYCFTAPVTARMVRATRAGSSIIGMCPTPGKIVKVACGRRSWAFVRYLATGRSASFSDHAIVTGHGRGFSGWICQSLAKRSSATTELAITSSAISTIRAADSRSPWHAMSRYPNLRTVADLSNSGASGRKRRPFALFLSTALDASV